MIRIFTAAFLISATAAMAETPVERGEYLIRGPAGCGNCHTPQTPDGPVADMQTGATRKKRG